MAVESTLGLGMPTGPAEASAPAGPSRTGVLLCFVSAISFGLAAVFAKESFAAGWSVPALLSTRFLVAAAVLWVVVAIRRPARPSARSVLTCLGLGAIGYALQAGCYFGALTKLDASVVGQLLYVYPALVFLLAVLRRREKWSRRKLFALGATTAGLVLLLQGGGGTTGWAPVGVLLALGSAVIYSIYITIADTLPTDLDPVLTTAIVCTAAGLSVGGFGALTGGLQLPDRPSGWLWMLLFAVVSTVVSIFTFLAGLRLVGPSTAAILSCIEPVVTAASAAIVYGEQLSLWQIAGGVAVLASVVLLQARRRVRS